MAPQKRKRDADEAEDDWSDVELVAQDDSDSDSDIDISSALTGKKRRTDSSSRGPRAAPAALDDDGENEEDLQEIIRESIAKRNVKGGTELLKKTKGKTKIAKGEVGGGSFQSMGAPHYS